MIDYKPFLFSLSLFIGLLLVNPFQLKTQGFWVMQPSISADTSVFADDFEADPQGRWQVRVRGSSSGPTGIQQTVGHETSGGNPDGFRAMTHSTDGDGSIFVTHVYTAQYYLPSDQGAIASLNYTEDRTSLDGRPVGSRVVVVQGGQVHVAVLSTFRDQVWSTESVQGLTAQDFSPAPDFSASGDTIWFGYERANTNTNANAVRVNEHGIDNWQVEVFSGPPPSPGVSCTLEPQTLTSRVGIETTLTVTVEDDGQPAEGIIVAVAVTSGPNVGKSSADTTDAMGQATFTYLGDGGPGTDEIEARNELVGENFTCTAQQTWTPNRAPIARDDLLVTGSNPNPTVCGTDLFVLTNDSDPDGHGLSIIAVTQPAFGYAGSVTNEGDKLVIKIGRGSSAKFTYTISDKVSLDPSAWLPDTAEVTVLFDCGCLLGCTDVGNNCGSIPKAGSAIQDTVDLDLLRRFRDEVLQPTEVGARYVDMYYNIPELLFILLITQPALGAQAVRMVELLQPSLRNMLDGDGSALITQAQMDSVAAFFTAVSAAGSASLQQRIADELTRLGALDDYVGLPVRDVLTAVLGEPVGTAIEHEAQPAPTGFALRQNFPNPFQHTTEIRYVLSRPTPVSLTIYTILGQRVRTLIHESQMPGVKSVIWNGLDDGGVAVSSGVYLFHLQTPTHQASKTMVVRK